ncbi:MAG: hypothetical protein V1821_03305 [bacterium]
MAPNPESNWQNKDPLFFDPLKRTDNAEIAGNQTETAEKPPEESAAKRVFELIADQKGREVKSPGMIVESLRSAETKWKRDQLREALMTAEHQLGIYEGGPEALTRERDILTQQLIDTENLEDKQRYQSVISQVENLIKDPSKIKILEERYKNVQEALGEYFAEAPELRDIPEELGQTKEEALATHSFIMENMPGENQAEKYAAFRKYRQAERKKLPAIVPEKLAAADALSQGETKKPPSSPEASLEQEERTSKIKEMLGFEQEIVALTQEQQQRSVSETLTRLGADFDFQTLRNTPEIWTSLLTFNPNQIYQGEVNPIGQTQEHIKKILAKKQTELAGTIDQDKQAALEDKIKLLQQFSEILSQPNLSEIAGLSASIRLFESVPNFVSAPESIAKMTLEQINEELIDLQSAKHKLTKILSPPAEKKAEAEAEARTTGFVPSTNYDDF